MAGIPLSWNDSIFSSVTNSGSVILKNGGAVSNKSITDSGNMASVVGEGSFTVNQVRINSREGVRLGGDGDIVINNSYIETTGTGADHADGIQAYSPGSSGNLTITNSSIVSHNTAANAGLFIADNYGGSVTLNNVVFQGGPTGLKIYADDQPITVALKDVYFVGPFMFDPLVIEEIRSDIHITQWDNVRYATIVNGELVPGALIKAPLPVEGGNAAAPGVPTIVSVSDDSGIGSDGITHDNTITLTGNAAANSAVKVFDGTKAIGTVTAASNGAWSFTSSALADGAHKFTATATSSGVTSQASAARSVSVDTVAPTAPTIKMSTSAATLASTHVAQLTGTAEVNSTVKVFDGSTQIGTATANSSGAWTFTTKSLTNGAHNFTAKAMDVAGNTGAASTALAVTIATPTAPATPNAPTIASFSQDSGVVGDHITNDNTLTLTGTAIANSTIKVYDGAKQVGTTTANSSGSWSYTAAALSDAKHTLTATATDSQGKTSSASANLDVTIDTTAPTAPTIASTSGGTVQSATARAASSSNNVVNLTGTGESKSTIDIFDGSSKIGTATAAADGSWSFTTSQLSTGQHTFTAKATDVAGNIGKTSTVLNVSVSSSTSEGPAAPKIVSFSSDSGKVGDFITSDNSLTLNGTATANSTVTLYDKGGKIGTATSDGTGAWSFKTATLTDGAHNLTATDTNSVGKTSAASEAVSVTIDTHAPTAPKMGIYSTSGTAVSGTTANNDFILKGTAEASSTVKIFDADKQIGTATTNSSGAWSFEATDLANGGHNFTSKAMDAAGNTSSASAASGITVSAPTTVPKTASIDFTNLYEGWNDTATIKGMANPYTQIKLLDGTQSLGSVKAGSDGSWSFKTSALSDTVHTFSAQQIDSTGRVVATSPDKAILGTTRSDTLTSTTGDDLLVGNGGSDTFVFANNFGNDTIKDFEAEYAVGWRHDTIQFSKSVFDDFASMISHASQVGQDVVISTGSNSLTLKNATLSGLDHYDFHFA
ncbi:hypothetical protein GGQ85_004166 [Nitrobacter vulgaris]|uniref:Ig-like domain-containing protein n=1 Tax=Nitrobacter vulgaris TaxID=29421 RepID=UPI0028612EC0|nr:Ig-like domain-containing protein [Nitrobacter vulgaris]MDR6306434.1 hypothetical protein [Nitrobacter vulgaris]